VFNPITLAELDPGAQAATPAYNCSAQPARTEGARRTRTALRRSRRCLWSRSFL